MTWFRKLVKHVKVGSKLAVSIAHAIAGGYLLGQKPPQRNLLTKLGAGLLLLESRRWLLKARKSNFAFQNHIHTHTQVTVDLPRHQVYEIWKNPENIPFLMPHITGVSRINNKASLWNIAQSDDALEWICYLVKDVPDKNLTWHSSELSRVGSELDLKFSKLSADSTAIKLSITYHAAENLGNKPINSLFSPTFENLIAMDIKMLNYNLTNRKI